jgi:hypothetical protein
MHSLIEIIDGFTTSNFNKTFRRSGVILFYLFWGQISNNCNYRKKFEYLVKFILMKIRINLSNMKPIQPIQFMLNQFKIYD